MGSSSSTPPPPPTIHCTFNLNDKGQKIGYRIFTSNGKRARGTLGEDYGIYFHTFGNECGDFADFVREYFAKIKAKDNYYLKDGSEFLKRFVEIKGSITLKIPENTTWLYNVDIPSKPWSPGIPRVFYKDDYYKETTQSINTRNKLKNSYDTLFNYLDEISKELNLIESPKKDYINKHVNEASRLLDVLTKNEKQILKIDILNILRHRKILTIMENDMKKKKPKMVLTRYYNVQRLGQFFFEGVHFQLHKEQSPKNFEFWARYFNDYVTKMKVYGDKIKKGTDIENNLKDYRKINALYISLRSDTFWNGLNSAEDIATKYLTSIYNICSILISKIKNFTIKSMINNINIDDLKLVELADKIIIKLIPEIIGVVELEPGKNSKYNSIINNLRNLKDNYKKLKETRGKFKTLRLFNQTYKFKCGKFGQEHHMILTFNSRKNEPYLINPTDKFKEGGVLYSPNIYKEEIGPLCVKQKNEKGYRSLERCYDYESKQRCESNLNSIDKTTTSSTFKKELIDTINGINIYGSSAKLFNPNSTLHNKEIDNTNGDKIRNLKIKLDTTEAQPTIKNLKPTTTIATTTTEYIHKEVIQQPPPETTQAKLLKIPDPIIPNGNYYVSLVDKNGSEKYVNVFKKEMNNKIYYFLKSVNKDTNKDQSYQNKLKNNSIFTVRNNPFPNYNNKPYNFITIEFKVANNNNQSTYFLRTEDNTSKVIITNKDTDIEKPFNWYFLPEYINESPNENGPIEVYLKPVTENLKDYCYLNDDNETKNDKNLQYIENDATINPILNILLNNNRTSLNDDENIPIIRCNSDLKPVSIEDKKPVSYLKFEFHSSLEQN